MLKNNIIIHTEIKENKTNMEMRGKRCMFRHKELQTLTSSDGNNDQNNSSHNDHHLETNYLCLLKCYC